jgi:SAM-dependent methyltransferase
MSTARRSTSSGDFDRVARVYRALEWLTFGRDLERARFRFLPLLASCRDILVIGDGDGRCTAKLAALAPGARLHCIDTSAAMLAMLHARLPADVRARVTTEQRDVRTLLPAPDRWDAVVTMFVLDCLTTADVERVARTLAASLRPGGRWLFADFVLPPRGWRRLRARLWIALLYAFFRWRTGLDVSTVPESEAALAAAGLRLEAGDELQHGMIRCGLWEKSGKAARP